MTVNQIYQGKAKKPAPAQLRSFRLYDNSFNATSIIIVPIYLVQWQKQPEQEQEQLLAKLLDATSGYKSRDNQLVVLPRTGLQTPWSSKVLDICTMCQLSNICAIEQGLVWNFVCERDRHLYHKLCFDPMTQQIYYEPPDMDDFFSKAVAQSVVSIDTGTKLERYNQKQGLGLDKSSIDYLRNIFTRINRLPTDVELMMFAQVNSEHCRHMIFNGQWFIDNHPCQDTLLQQIKATSEAAPTGIISAYSDNAAVIEGWQSEQLEVDNTGNYHFNKRLTHHCIKVETHNHPTAIAPWEGAATGTGGEIRDEGATGRGARPKAGMSGFIVANLQLPKLPQPWEKKQPLPDHAKPLEIMISGPLGSSNYANEFGRPVISGLFRTVDSCVAGCRYANIKPIMIAGGIGSIFDGNTHKRKISGDYPVIVLGGASMRIGIGGGSTSSISSGRNSRQIDFASVQRDNPEMERRCQQVLDACVATEHNPIAFIHDVGAGGLSNACPEMAYQSGLGAIINLDLVPCDDTSLSPMEIWCNEAQERYVLAIHPDQQATFEAICLRERCPYAVIGKTTQNQHLLVTSNSTKVVDMPTQTLFSDLPPMRINCHHQPKKLRQSKIQCSLPIAKVLRLILQCPSVASKDFLITIADRSITGLVAGEPMIGPWQVPVADCALSATGFRGYQAEAMAVGERTPLAIANHQASVRMALAELLTNIVSCGDASLARIKLSANWMAACGQSEQRLALYQAVETLSKACKQLGLAIPVGKDSLSMESSWQDDQGQIHRAMSPLSLVITGYCRVENLRLRLTPQIVTDRQSRLYFIDLADGKQRLGFSALSQILADTGEETPDLENISMLAEFVSFITEASRKELILAYHDRSDGGLWACLCEMAFAGHTGLDIDISLLGNDPLRILANEELGAVIQVSTEHEQQLEKLARAYRLIMHPVAKVTKDRAITIRDKNNVLFAQDVSELEQIWAQTSWQIEQIRDDTYTSQQAFKRLADWDRTYLINRPTYIAGELDAPVVTGTRPKIAILREQGTNGHNEMSCAFFEAGFQPVDVHMNDLIHGIHKLKDFQGLIACGGFSYGDVLGGGTGWASVILHNNRLRDEFYSFFLRDSSFSLGVCNGCQMLSQLAELIPTTHDFPYFSENDSGRFEGRLTNIMVEKSASVLLTGMEGSLLVTAVAHGFGKIENNNPKLATVALRYADSHGNQATKYPDNPNGSAHAIAGLCSDDGRVTIMMPHPERNFLWHQSGWHKNRNKWHSRYGPWFRMFINARKFCDF